MVVTADINDDTAFGGYVHRTYIDGSLFHVEVRNTSHHIREKFALPPKVALFANYNGQSQPVYVNSIQFRNYTMTDAELAELGGPDPAGIPGAALPVDIRISRNSAGLSLSWDAEGYRLESTDDLNRAAWKIVEGAADNAITVPFETRHRFYRLRSAEADQP